MNDIETYASKEVYDRLGVSSSTLRKWCLVLESKGIAFNKDSGGKRQFTLEDVLLLEKYKALVQEQGVHQEIASTVILNLTDPTMSTMLGLANTASGNERKEDSTKLSVLDHKMDTVLQVFAGIAENIKRQDEKIDLLIQQNEELKVYIAASKEEPKKGWLAKLFGK